MLQTMRSVYEFDNVHDGQRVFRALLEAMANPGRMCDIAAEAGRFAGDEGGLAALFSIMKRRCMLKKTDSLRKPCTV